MKKIKLLNQEQKLEKNELKLFEKNSNISLPNDYKEFILLNNGGVPEENLFKGTNFEARIADFYSIKYGRFPMENLLEMLHSEESLPKHFYPFGSNLGGSDYVFSIKEEDYGVVYFYHYDGSPPYKLADSFKEFIDSLEKEDYTF